MILVGWRIPSSNEEIEKLRNGELEKQFSEDFEKQTDIENLILIVIFHNS